MTHRALPHEELLVLVDEQDREVGTSSKLAAHREGRLHRAVSVVLRDGAGQVLLQRRALTKYHSAGLWSNTCCGHPRPGESPVDAASRRLRAELGITDVLLKPVGTFRYRAALRNGLIEHELDHVLIGNWTGEPVPDPAEVSAVRWVHPAQLSVELMAYPQRFTAWTPHVLTAVATVTG